jgi:hypothetical protein
LRLASASTPQKGPAVALALSAFCFPYPERRAPMSFKDDLAQMHADCDEAFADAATFRPVEGDDVEGVLVERFSPEPTIGFDQARGPEADTLLRVLKSKLPARPTKNDQFIIGAETFRVIAPADSDDDDALRWSVKVIKVRAS